MSDGLIRQLIAKLPDEPRWIDVRGMLFSGHAQVIGDSIGQGIVVKVQHDALSAIGIVGRPPARAILAAVDGVTDMTPVVVQLEDAEWVGQCLGARAGQGEAWTSERTIAHRLRPDAWPEPGCVDVDVRLLAATDPLAHLPAGLRHEMTHATAFAPVAAVIVDGQPASFCYPVWRTETLWDVSIDTLGPYRRRGLAMRAVHFMIDRLRREGLQPVWCAIESNTPSLRLAAKLGFEPESSFMVFSRGPWAILSGGFTG